MSHSYQILMAIFLVRTTMQAKKLVIEVIVFTVLAIGLLLTTLPGPAILVILSGLTILSIESAWVRNLLKQIRDKLSKNKSSEPAPNTNGQ